MSLELLITTNILRSWSKAMVTVNGSKPEIREMMIRNHHIYALKLHSVTFFF